jgi:hypothetical protein
LYYFTKGNSVLHPQVLKECSKSEELHMAVASGRACNFQYLDDLMAVKAVYGGNEWQKIACMRALKQRGFEEAEVEDRARLLKESFDFT